LDLQKTGYGFGYGSLWSLPVLLLRPAEPSPFALPFFRLIGLMGRLQHRPQQQEGVVLATKWSPWA
jgi:hypothetical protein